MTQALSPRFSLAKDMALFLDFDGTLAPLQDNPDAVFMPHAAALLIRNSARKLKGALAVISGRDIEDLNRRTPDNIWRMGNHGLYAMPPGSQIIPAKAKLPKPMLGDMKKLVKSLPGTRLEEKGPTAALHYRGAPQHGPACISGLESIVADYSGYKVQTGNNICEVKLLAADKGDALARQMQKSSFSGRRPVMIGDDTTDEDAIARAQELGGTGIKVGTGKTCAQYRVEKVNDVYKLLETLS